MNSKQSRIDELLRRINLITNNFTIDYIDKCPRLGLVNPNNRDTLIQYISPRLTKSQMVLWLEGFGIGIQGRMYEKINYDT